MAVKTKKITKRLKPRLSVNKLGEYLSAAPYRRRKILQDAKYPQTVIFKRYNSAANIIRDFFVSDRRHESMVQDAIEKFRQQKPTSKYQREVIHSCIEALTRFMQFIEESSFPEGNEFQDGISISASIAIEGTQVSVRPEILIHEKGKVVGGVKLYFSKSFPLSKDSAEYIGTLLMKYLELKLDRPIKSRNCFVIDVFSKTIYTAPKSHIRRFQDIEAACQEISSRWNSI
ncbi:hypothetical protein GU926_11430 [Nibribacter ruber]|uniref:Uncharacterized protein n=1 Tax=Nibribacter ruber TaxID=2698458 RepID=A0A6P1NVZ6_9BACT|nr:hypothetical protein [Nibribacter ruber]QHL88006.1 hypothetical protein GU926_11430 [Nibribacter ruber]